MIDHIGIAVTNYPRAKDFYLTALKPLGYGLVMDLPAEVTGGSPAGGFGEGQKPDFWIGEVKQTPSHSHIALLAKSRAAVDAFYNAALAAGAKDNGAPGLRAHYHPNYYGAFVIDPDGHNIEAVCHDPA